MGEIRQKLHRPADMLVLAAALAAVGLAPSALMMPRSAVSPSFRTTHPALLPLIRQKGSAASPRALPLAMQAEESAVAPEMESMCIEDEAVEECVIAQWPAGKIAVSQSVAETAKLGGLFFSWFFLNVMYNITNKRCQNAFPMPWTMTVVSLFVGIPWVLMLWATGIRKAPKLDWKGMKTLLPIGAAHALGHAGAVIALGAGAVSFAQTVKAAEPVFTCVLSYFVLGTVFKPQVYASLFPIIVGVSLASLKELSFTMRSLVGALTSNVAFASRAVLSKKTMDKPVGENMTPPNLYGVLTIMAFLFSFPFALYYEGPGFMAAWKLATAKVGAFWLTRQMILDGLYYYAYNEVAFVALNKVSPVTHSIANTIKRVCIILATVLVFGNKMTGLGAAGSAIAIFGTFVYSIAKSKYK